MTSENKRHRRIPLLPLLTALLACIAVLAGCARTESGGPPAQTQSTQPTVSTTAPTESQPPTETITLPIETEPTVPATETAPTESVPTEPAQPQIGDQPPELTGLLERGGVCYETLAQNGCSQLVTVAAEGTCADIRFYICRDGLWQEDPDLSCSGYVGRGGVVSDKREGDGGTPAGLYAIGSAFYIYDAPATSLDAFRIASDTYWVDDPDSKFYNQRVEGTDQKDWNSAEQMIRYDVYRYGFVVDYNTAGVYGAGSAIFFHICDHPTAGCIATSEGKVLAYLAELDASRQPHILIVNN